MQTTTDLSITVKVDTAAARREVESFRQYAMQTLAEIQAAYAAAGQKLSPGSDRR